MLLNIPDALIVIKMFVCKLLAFLVIFAVFWQFKGISLKLFTFETFEL